MRKPITFVAEIDEENIVVREDGELRHDALVILDDPEMMGALREGYYCAKCYEGQQDAMPKKCWLCGFPMRDKQSEFIAKGYRGSIRTGPSTSIADELLLMEEWAEREAMSRRDPVTRPSQVWLPGDAI